MIDTNSKKLYEGNTLSIGNFSKLSIRGTPHESPSKHSSKDPTQNYALTKRLLRYFKTQIISINDNY